MHLTQLLLGFKVGTITTNHVAANLKSSSVVAALGNTWSHAVTCRFWIKREDTGNHRYIEIVKSPVCGLTTIPIELGVRGIHGT